MVVCCECDLFFVLLLNFLSLALGLLCKSLRVHMVCCIRRQRGTWFSVALQLVQLWVWKTCGHSVTLGQWCQVVLDSNIGSTNG